MSYSWDHILRRRHASVATYILIVVNTAIYLASSYQSFFVKVNEWWVDTFSYVPVLMMNPAQWYRIVTSMFLHGDIFHIFFNMLFLYWFGREVEQLLGVAKFLTLYFASGVVATIFHTGFMPITGVLGMVVPALGASGAISGILGAFLMLYPRKRLSLCWFIYLIPLCFTTTSAVFLIFWFATQIIYGYLRFGGIAFFAHVGGFVSGITLIGLLKRGKPIEHLYLFPFEIPKPLGLGRTIKMILTILLISVLGGALYSFVEASRTSNIYLMDITTCSGGRCYSDQAVYTPVKEEYVAPSTDLPRIAFNRLMWTGILRSGARCNVVASSIHMTSPRFPVPEYNVRIYIEIDGIGTYDDKCVLVRFNGSIKTQEIRVDIFGRASVGNALVIDVVSLTAEDVAKDAGEFIVRPLASMSSILTLSSVLVVVYKDKDIVEEEFPYIPSYIPWA